MRRKQKFSCKALRQLGEKYPSLTLTNLRSLQNDWLFLLVICSQKKFTKQINETSLCCHFWKPLVHYNEERTCLKIVCMINHRRFINQGSLKLMGTIIGLSPWGISCSRLFKPSIDPQIFAPKAAICNLASYPKGIGSLLAGPYSISTAVKPCSDEIY